MTELESILKELEQDLPDTGPKPFSEIDFSLDDKGNYREDALGFFNKDVKEMNVEEQMKWAEMRDHYKAKNQERAQPDYGRRPDGTKKGTGWLGPLRLPDGSVATEYTMQSQAVKKDGERIDFPTLVPTLSQDEIDLMVNDIIPNKKKIPDAIAQKAVDFANKRLAQGKSVFARDTGEKAPEEYDINDPDFLSKVGSKSLAGETKNVREFTALEYMAETGMEISLDSANGPLAALTGASRRIPDKIDNKITGTIAAGGKLEDFGFSGRLTRFYNFEELSVEGQDKYLRKAPELFTAAKKWEREMEDNLSMTHNEFHKARTQFIKEKAAEIMGKRQRVRENASAQLLDTPWSFGRLIGRGLNPFAYGAEFAAGRVGGAAIAGHVGGLIGQFVLPMVIATVGKYQELTTPDFDVEGNVRGKPDDPQTALGKAIFHGTVETGVEMGVGAAVGMGTARLLKPLKGPFNDAIIRLSGTSTGGASGKAIRGFAKLVSGMTAFNRYTAFHGIVPELVEEFIQQTIEESYAIKDADMAGTAFDRLTNAATDFKWLETAEGFVLIELAGKLGMFVGSGRQRFKAERGARAILIEMGRNPAIVNMMSTEQVFATMDATFTGESGHVLASALEGAGEKITTEAHRLANLLNTEEYAGVKESYDAEMKKKEEAESKKTGKPVTLARRREASVEAAWAALGEGATKGTTEDGNVEIINLERQRSDDKQSKASREAAEDVIIETAERPIYDVDGSNVVLDEDGHIVISADVFLELIDAANAIKQRREREKANRDAKGGIEIKDNRAGYLIRDTNGQFPTIYAPTEELARKASEKMHRLTQARVEIMEKRAQVASNLANITMAKGTNVILVGTDDDAERAIASNSAFRSKEGAVLRWVPGARGITSPDKKHVIINLGAIRSIGSLIYTMKHEGMHTLDIGWTRADLENLCSKLKLKDREGNPLTADKLIQNMKEDHESRGYPLDDEGVIISEILAELQESVVGAVETKLFGDWAKSILSKVKKSNGTELSPEEKRIAQAKLLEPTHRSVTIDNQMQAAFEQPADERIAKEIAEGEAEEGEIAEGEASEDAAPPDASGVESDKKALTPDEIDNITGVDDLTPDMLRLLDEKHTSEEIQAMTAKELQDALRELAKEAEFEAGEEAGVGVAEEAEVGVAEEETEESPEVENPPESASKALEGAEIEASEAPAAPEGVGVDEEAPPSAPAAVEAPDTAVGDLTFSSLSEGQRGALEQDGTEEDNFNKLTLPERIEVIRDALETYGPEADLEAFEKEHPRAEKPAEVEEGKETEAEEAEEGKEAEEVPVDKDEKLRELRGKARGLTHFDIHYTEKLVKGATTAVQNAQADITRYQDAIESQNRQPAEQRTDYGPALKSSKVKLRKALKVLAERGARLKKLTQERDEALSELKKLAPGNRFNDPNISDITGKPMTADEIKVERQKRRDELKKLKEQESGEKRLPLTATSIKAFIDAHPGGQYDLLWHWLQHGKRLFARPGPNSGGEYDNYRRLPNNVQYLLTGPKRAGGSRIDTAAEELAEIGVLHYDELSGEHITDFLVDEFVRQYDDYRAWKEAGAPTASQLEEEHYRAKEEMALRWKGPETVDSDAMRRKDLVKINGEWLTVKKDSAGNTFLQDGTTVEVDGNVEVDIYIKPNEDGYLKALEEYQEQEKQAKADQDAAFAEEIKELGIDPEAADLLEWVLPEDELAKANLSEQEQRRQEALDEFEADAKKLTGAKEALSLAHQTIDEAKLEEEELARQRKRREEKEEIEKKLQAPVKGTMGDTTRSLFKGTSDIPLFTEQDGRHQSGPQNAMFKLSSEIEETKDLVALHNLNASELGKVLEIGGFVMPSIAITRKGVGFTNFGDISVIFNKDTIDPRISKANRIYGSDAYTASFPTVHYDIDAYTARQIDKRVFDALGNSVPSFSSYDIETDIRRTFGDVRAAYYDNKHIRNTYDAERKTKKTLMKYDEWFDTLFKGVVKGSGIRNNADLFTPSGTRKSFKATHMPITASNVLKQMLKSEKEGGEDFHFGFSSFAGRAAKQIPSIAALQKEKGRIQQLSREEFDALEKTLSDEYMGLIADFITKNNKGSIQDVSEWFTESIAATPSTIMARGNQRGEGFYTMDADTANKLHDIATKAKALPRSYFEAKPHRIVKPWEAAAFVVPKGTPKTLTDAIREQGGRVYSYDGAENRVEVVNKAAQEQNAMFKLPDNEKSAEAKKLIAEIEKLQAQLDMIEGDQTPVVNVETGETGKAGDMGAVRRSSEVIRKVAEGYDEAARYTEVEPFSDADLKVAAKAEGYADLPKKGILSIYEQVAQRVIAAPDQSSDAQLSPVESAGLMMAAARVARWANRVVKFSQNPADQAAVAHFSAEAERAMKTLMLIDQALLKAGHLTSRALSARKISYNKFLNIHYRLAAEEKARGRQFDEIELAQKKKELIEWQDKYNKLEVQLQAHEAAANEAERLQQEYEAAKKDFEAAKKLSGADVTTIVKQAWSQVLDENPLAEEEDVPALAKMVSTRTGSTMEQAYAVLASFADHNTMFRLGKFNTNLSADNKMALARKLSYAAKSGLAIEREKAEQSRKGRVAAGAKEYEKKGPAPAGAKKRLNMGEMTQEEFDALMERRKARAAITEAIIAAIEENPNGKMKELVSAAKGFLAGTKYGALEDREFMDIAIDYSRERPEDTRTDVEIRHSQLNSEIRQALRILDLLNGVIPHQRGRHSTPTSVDMRTVRKLVRSVEIPEAMKEHLIASVNKTMQTRLLNTIEELEKAIEENQVLSRDEKLGIEKHPETVALEKRVAALRVIYNELSAVKANREAGMRAAANNRLIQWRNRLAQAKEGIFAEPEKRTPEAVIADIEEEIKKTKEEIQALKKNDPRQVAKRIHAIVEKADATIAQINKLIDEGNARDTKPYTTDAEKAAAMATEPREQTVRREQRIRMREALNREREAWISQNPIDSFFKEVSRQLDSLERRKAKVAHRLTNKLFQKSDAARKEYTKELYLARKELAAMQAELDEEIRSAEQRSRGLSGHIKLGLSHTNDISRAVMASVDISFLGIQGAIGTRTDLLFNRGRITQQAWREAWRGAKSEAYIGEMIHKLLNDPTTELFIKHGGDINALANELFGANYAAKFVAKMSKYHGPLKTPVNLMGRTIEASERHFIVMGAVMRAEMFKRLVNMVGIANLSEAELDLVANMVNIATGSASKDSFGGAPRTLGKLMWAARLFASRLARLTGGNGLFYHAGAKPGHKAGILLNWKGFSTEYKKLVLRQHMEDFISLAVFSVVLKSVLGLLWRQEPEDEDELWRKMVLWIFGPAKIESFGIDLTGGVWRLYAAMERMAGIKTYTYSGKPASPRNTVADIGRMMRGTTNPLIGFGLDMIGKDFLGEPYGPLAGYKGRNYPMDWKASAIGTLKIPASIMPLSIQDASEVAGQVIADGITWQGMLGAALSIPFVLSGSGSGGAPRPKDYAWNRHKGVINMITKAEKEAKDTHNYDKVNKLREQFAWNVRNHKEMERLHKQAKKWEAVDKELSNSYYNEMEALWNERNKNLY